MRRLPLVSGVGTTLKNRRAASLWLNDLVSEFVKPQRQAAGKEARLVPRNTVGADAHGVIDRAGPLGCLRRHLLHTYQVEISTGSFRRQIGNRRRPVARGASGKRHCCNHGAERPGASKRYLSGGIVRRSCVASAPLRGAAFRCPVVPAMGEERLHAAFAGACEDRRTARDGTPG